MTDPNDEAGTEADKPSEPDAIGHLSWYGERSGVPVTVPSGTASGTFAGLTPPPLPPPPVSPSTPSPSAPTGGNLGSGPSWASGRRRARGSWWAVGGASVVAVVVVSLLVVGGGGNDAAAAVLNAVHSTLADKTAAVTLDVQGSAAGQSIDLTGSGGIDFTTDAMQLSMTLPAGGQQLQMQAVYLGGTVYMSIPGVAQVVPGKSWVSIDLSSLDPSDSGGSTNGLGAGGNPAAALPLLAQQGSSVSSLGASTVDGVAVEGYQVSISQSAMQSDLSDANIPSWVRQSMSNVDIGGLGFKVYVDGQGRLRRESMSVQISAGSVPVSMTVSLDFSDYGSPVDVTAPPADQVVDMQQFLQTAQQAGGAAT